MANWIKSLHADLHRNEDGKITLVAAIMMLAMVVLIGLIGNAGHAVNQKIEAQNAADAAAFSSALWMARGMNALTATNHMLGEATALCAIHEALGGPGMDLEIEENTNENRVLDQVINATKDLAPIGPGVPYVIPVLTQIDEKIINFTTDRTSPDDEELDAYAMLYDSRIRLKRELTGLLIAKSFADLGFLVPPPWGYATAAIAYGIHIYATSQIVLIAKEWVVLDAIELVAKASKKLKLEIIEGQLIPTLAAHADFVSGYDSQSEEFKAGILNSAVERILLDLEQRHDVTMAVFPAADKLRLPVVPEPKPNLQQGSNVSGWGGDDTSPPDSDDGGLDDLKDKLDKSKREMRAQIQDLKNFLEDLDDYEKEIDDLLEQDDITDEDKAELEQEKQEIAESRIAANVRINKLTQKLNELEQEETKLAGALGQSKPAFSKNPSETRIPSLMNQSQERSTQWMRASYPYTDSFRAPIRSMFEKWLPKSKAADHFTKWSNRYTMIKAWQFRSGYRIAKSGDSATWNKSEDPISMLVMKDSFDGEQPRKGLEPWTTETAEGKQQAEELFTLIGFAHRDFKPLFSTVVYPASSSKGMTTYAQAIFYNGNENSAAGSAERQSTFGWDTLNWDPASEAREWAAPPQKSSAKWPWEIFESSDQKVKIKLNWQAKLMPITPSRLSESDEDLSGNMADNIGHAIEYFEELGTH